jgi:hypothetical protein
VAFIMGDAEELLPNWEAVEGEDGRTYYWNVDTDETTWDKPVLVKATSAVAAKYVESARQSSSSGASSSTQELESLRAGGSAVAQLSQRFSNHSVDDVAGEASPGKRGSGKVASPSPLPVAVLIATVLPACFFVFVCARAVVAIESKSKATGVANMKRYQELKAAMANAEAPTSSSPSRKPPPPKVDLYK